MRFYTNVQMVGDNFLVRGYENGKHFAIREKFYPTLFVQSRRKQNTKHWMVNMLNLSNLVQFAIVANLSRSMMVSKTLRYMEMIDISINISQRNIQKKKLSLILVRSNFSH